MTHDNPSRGKVIGLFLGRAQSHWPGKPPSAILKHPVDHPVIIRKTGLSGDEQADLSVHGGPEKAIHQYASEHMAHWKSNFSDRAHQFHPGSFGENISSTGLDECNLCLGDTLRLGTALVQVCQGRQPCWKLNAHTGLKNMALEFQKTGRTGWYYRVLQGGVVKVDDSIELLERLHPNWPLRRLIAARFDTRLDLSVARELSNIAELSRNWRDAFARKSCAGFQEDTSARLEGPAA